MIDQETLVNLIIIDSGGSSTGSFNSHMRGETSVS